jgi:hypothetical protein
MPPHQQRVIDEREQLAEKCDKLKVFLWGAIFNSLPTEERSRLIQQLGFMLAYLGILDQRIAAF